MTHAKHITNAADAAKEKLDQYTQDMVQWHFSPATGCPYWLEWAKEADWNPLTEVSGFADMIAFREF